MVSDLSSPTVMTTITNKNETNISINPSIGLWRKPMPYGFMATFIHVDQPPTHAGVERVHAAIGRLLSTGKQFKGPRGLAALLLCCLAP